MKCRFIFILLFCTSTTSFAQSKYGIRKINSFFIEHVPGNIRADSVGNPIFQGPDTIHTVYVETGSNTIKWIAAWKDGKSFSVITTAINERPFVVGVNSRTNEKIILKPAKGNKLWLLQFDKKATSSKPPVKPKRGEIILQGRSAGKLFIQRVGRSTELETIPSV